MALLSTGELAGVLGLAISSGLSLRKGPPTHPPGLVEKFGGPGPGLRIRNPFRAPCCAPAKPRILPSRAGLAPRLKQTPELAPAGPIPSICLLPWLGAQAAPARRRGSAWWAIEPESESGLGRSGCAGPPPGACGCAKPEWRCWSFLPAVRSRKWMSRRACSECSPVHAPSLSAPLRAPEELALNSIPLVAGWRWWWMRADWQIHLRQRNLRPQPPRPSGPDLKASRPRSRPICDIDGPEGLLTYAGYGVDELGGLTAASWKRPNLLIWGDLPQASISLRAFENDVQNAPSGELPYPRHE